MVQAENLHKNGCFGGAFQTSNVICVCEVAGRPNSRMKTKAVDIRRPEFNHIGEMPHWKPGDTLKFTIKTDGSLRQDSLGWAILPYERYEKTSWSGWLPLAGIE